MASSMPHRHRCAHPLGNQYNQYWVGFGGGGVSARNRQPRVSGRSASLDAW